MTGVARRVAQTAVAPRDLPGQWRETVRRSPVAVLGVVLMAVGTLGSDLLRVWQGADLPALVLVEVATAGVVLLVLAMFRSWLEILCEAWLVGGGLSLLLTFGLTVAGHPLDDGRADLDLVHLSLAWFVGAALVLVRRDLFPGRPALDALMCLVLGLRALLWLTIFLGSAVQLPGAVGLARVWHLLAAAVAVVLVTWLVRSGWTPGYERRVFTGARVPYAVAALVLGVALATQTSAPHAPTLAQTVIGGGYLTALLLRQMVSTNRLLEAGRRAQEQERYFRTLVQDSHDVIALCSADGRLDYVSPAAERVLATPDAAAAVADPASSTLAGLLRSDPGPVAEALALAQEDGEARLQVHTPEQVLEASLAAREQGFVVAVRDVTERDRLRQRLHRLAYVDSLTGLANRRSLVEHLDAVLRTAEDPSRLCVCFLDLDRFKQVNDSSGHHAGDGLLQQVAQRLTDAGGPGLVLARLGGDEFVAVTEGGRADATAVARRVRSAMSRPFVVADRVHQVGVSIGIAVGERGLVAEELLHRADLAMYAAKKNRLSWGFYDPGLSVAARRRADDDHELATSWSADSVRLHLQPIVRTDTLEVTSTEALLRWQMPDGAVLGPARVLDYAARTGQLTRLTGWTATHATRIMARLGPGSVPLALNLPAGVLDVPRLPARLRSMLERSGLTPGDVHLELTEEAMVDHGPEAIATLQELRDAGFRVYVDDFGTGYSALGYLVHLPLDGLKIDRAFVRELPTSQAARSIVAGVVRIAEDLGVTVVAEGIETAAEAGWVRRLGVPLAQGYWYARPRDAELLQRVDELAHWGDHLGEGGARHAAATSFALGGAEC